MSTIPAQKLTVCICGGGSLGIVSAAVMMANHATVNILTGHPASWHHEIEVTDQAGKSYAGHLNIVTDSAGEALENADIVLLCVPGYMIESTLRNLLPHLHHGIAVGAIVSSTGFFFFAHEILPEDITLFGFQRVPFIARTREYGHTGDLLGYKASVNVAIEHSHDAEALRSSLEQLFATPTNLLQNFYEAALTNSNPILHTARLYSMWHDFNGEPAATRPYFYADWSDRASEILIAMDREFMQLLSTLGLPQGAVPPLLEYYESHDATSLTRKLRSIPAFKPIVAPMSLTDGGWIPDFTNRYFTEDFPFGLRFIKDLAKKHNLATPVIDKVYDWGMSVQLP